MGSELPVSSERMPEEKKGNRSCFPGESSREQNSIKIKTTKTTTTATKKLSWRLFLRKLFTPLALQSITGHKAHVPPKPHKILGED